MPRWPKRTADERFWSKTIITESCWLWIGTKRTDGYGRFWTPGGDCYAHRFSYELVHGTIPEGLTLDHLCRNHSCVNPAHLDPVTPRENVLRGDGPGGRNARKTHCIHGHAYTPENTHWRPGGGRECRTCKNARNKARAA